MQNETTKTLLEWNYNQYHDRYAHLYPEDNSGLNNYKIGQQNISHSYDKVDKTFKEKKLQSTIKKNIITQKNMPHSWMRKQVHGDPNSYSSFKDVFEHRYLYNVNNPWPEGEVGYGPFDRPMSSQGYSVRSAQSQNKSVRSKNSNNGNRRKTGQNFRSSSVELLNDDEQQLFDRNNPAHVDESFLPSYGINHDNIKCAEDKQKNDHYKLEKVTNYH